MAPTIYAVTTGKRARWYQLDHWKDLRVFAEPGGATALAALLSGAYRPERGERVGVVVCGGNGDPGAVA
jgi:threonine dehydratase